MGVGVSKGDHPIVSPNYKCTCNSEDEINMRIEEKAAEKMALLEKEGHKCVVLLESLPPKVDWCKQDVCVRK